jgi:hypothetical protein
MFWNSPGNLQNAVAKITPNEAAEKLSAKPEFGRFFNASNGSDCALSLKDCLTLCNLTEMSNIH